MLAALSYVSPSNADAVEIVVGIGIVVYLAVDRRSSIPVPHC